MAISLSQEIAPHLPYLRRFARALTGSQQSGDAHVTACLEAIVADPEILDSTHGAKIGLYRLFHQLWNGLQLDPPLEAPEAEPSRRERTTRERLAEMTPESRQVLLLTTLEGFRQKEAALITGLSEAEISSLLDPPWPRSIARSPPAF